MRKIGDKLIKRVGEEEMHTDGHIFYVIVFSVVHSFLPFCLTNYEGE